MPTMPEIIHISLGAGIKADDTRTKCMFQFIVSDIPLHLETTPFLLEQNGESAISIPIRNGSSKLTTQRMDSVIAVDANNVGFAIRLRKVVRYVF